MTGPAVRASGGKVVFADQLRGVAALVVVLSHFFNVYPFAQPIVSAAVAAPEVALPLSWMTTAMTQPWINFGPFGVGLFFLVSGFVIPLSLRRHSPIAFLQARCLRIYPTYWAALAVGCLLVVASARYWGRPLPFDWTGFFANATLSHTTRHLPSLDLVNWTLVVELHFYLFAALARPWILRSSLLPMLAAVGVALALMAVQWTRLIGQPSFLEYIAMSIPYMLIGTAFHYHYAGALRTTALIAVVAGLGGAFLALYWSSSARAGSVTEVQSYGIAAGMFGLAYATRRWMPDLLPLRWLARISYPLYAVHFLAGLSIMTWLIAGPLQWSYSAASAATLVIVIAIATALHLVIERPTIAWGSALGRPRPGRLPGYDPNSYDPNSLASNPRGATSGATSVVFATRPGQSE